MAESFDNIIIFPKWKRVLEEESLQALKDKRYEEALTKLNQLLDHQADDYEIITGKLICLMELNRYTEAQDFCEEALAKKDENYLHYIHIYLTILFQTNQYHLLMEQIESEMDNPNLTPLQKEQFNQLYEVSQKMKVETEEDEALQLMHDFYESIDEGNYFEQWRLIQTLMKKKVQSDNNIIDLLTKESVHPVIKTAIYIWLKEENYSSPIQVRKFEKQSTFTPVDTEKWDSTYFYTNMLVYLEELEVSNPTLYDVTKKLLIYFTYVVYPFTPDEKDLIIIKEALIELGEEYLNLYDRCDSLQKGNDSIQYYKDVIRLSESLYTSIIEP